ncbi:MAG: hypothetical protein JO235_25780 [Chroococcidiopsidaceae cyanobacterium CP_BM_RX_35]|nr:hypothetical protein [Chroococcidiopsidaceae cyanobacterium CP_BM_RX_35]
MSISTLRFLIQGFHRWQQMLLGGNLCYLAGDSDRQAEKSSGMAVSTELPNSNEQSGRRYRRRVAVST